MPLTSMLHSKWATVVLEDNNNYIISNNLDVDDSMEAFIRLAEKDWLKASLDHKILHSADASFINY